MTVEITEHYAVISFKKTGAIHRLGLKWHRQWSCFASMCMFFLSFCLWFMPYSDKAVLIKWPLLSTFCCKMSRADLQCSKCFVPVFLSFQYYSTFPTLALY